MDQIQITCFRGHEPHLVLRARLSETCDFLRPILVSLGGPVMKGSSPLSGKFAYQPSSPSLPHIIIVTIHTEPVERFSPLSDP
jgi:hypothetical protein